MTNDDPARRAATLLKTIPFLVLATSGQDGPWSATLNHVIAHDATLLFCSHPASRHTIHIGANSTVSATGYQVRDDQLDGVQLRGTCEPVPRDQLAALHREFWEKAFPDARQRENVMVGLEDFGPSSARDLYAVSVTEAWVRDTEAWAREGKDLRVPVDLPALTAFLKDATVPEAR
ncbi:pyridoxamine 5'-phosphate oxidase family protein [Amycolatopsis rubida]|uniref:Pyridoxamine 5'-phosphate oxidase n=1 Tax=Amycolatopsis rubida TaxID=112413 RepID=A0A1I5ZH08_9PSEU|nr:MULTISPECIES: pyridoxamine 5'-phosphate oxidase family protein [Amycolatopsis]MYW93001.1 hypothetical protein [Amycolatopsis rubida]NEC57988.1 pyridoxamine 5'-phosphate oxidase family protein [Amycolatopsis rubida]OAP25526.1 Pyridoxamine 5'-phosphate oxidase [Amycolatopsis sp. M39]SFQ55764.1 Pyridoxamine 5'-phosphate oxidase [Amycolatopsis rubida]